MISGELDLASVDSLRSAVRAVLAEGAGTLLLDLTQVEFVDVAGLRAVGAIAAGCRALGCEPLLVLRRDGPVLRLCGLLQVLASSAPGPLDGLAVCFAPE
jgi:anti-anti-sigma factor